MKLISYYKRAVNYFKKSSQESIDEYFTNSKHNIKRGRNTNTNMSDIISLNCEDDYYEDDYDNYENDCSKLYEKAMINQRAFYLEGA